MNIKVISIVSTIVVFLLLITLIMQKGNYVSQAQNHYEETTTKSYKGTSQILEFVNNTIDTERNLWKLTTEALQNVKTSKQMADLESKIFPNVKGVNSIQNQTRKFSPTQDFYIISSFANVETDKKTGVKTLVGLNSISVESLLGKETQPQTEE